MLIIIDCLRKLVICKANFYAVWNSVRGISPHSGDDYVFPFASQLEREAADAGDAAVQEAVVHRVPSVWRGRPLHTEAGDPAGNVLMPFADPTHTTSAGAILQHSLLLYSSVVGAQERNKFMHFHLTISQCFVLFFILILSGNNII